MTHECTVRPAVHMSPHHAALMTACCGTHICIFITYHYKYQDFERIAAIMHVLTYCLQCVYIYGSCNCYIKSIIMWSTMKFIVDIYCNKGSFKLIFRLWFGRHELAMENADEHEFWAHRRSRVLKVYTYFQGPAMIYFAHFQTS